MDLVDEEDDAAIAVHHLFHDALQPVLELAAELGARQQGAHVQCHDAAVNERGGDVAGDDALREALRDGRLAHAGLADEHRVVLAAPRQDLDGAPDLVVAADDGVLTKCRVCN